MSDQLTHDSMVSDSARAEGALVLHAGSYGVSDRELIQGFVRERNQEAFAALLERHGPMVLGVCRRILGSVQDAEDTDVTWAGLDKVGGNNVAKGLAAIVHQKLGNNDTAAVDVGFVDGHVERLSTKTARAIIDESRKKLDSLRKDAAK